MTDQPQLWGTYVQTGNSIDGFLIQEVKPEIRSTWENAQARALALETRVDEIVAETWARFDASYFPAPTTFQPGATPVNVAAVVVAIIKQSGGNPSYAMVANAINAVLSPTT